MHGLVSGFGIVSEEGAEQLSLAPDEPPEAPLGLPMTPAPGFTLAKFEHNARLQIPSTRAVYFSKMERVNLSIAMGCAAKRAQIASATIQVTEGEHADELAVLLGLDGDGGRGLPSQTAAEVIVDMYRAITDGCYIGDPVWKWDEGLGAWYPDRVEHRDLRTIEGALYHPKTGELVGFIQKIQHGLTLQYAVLPMFHIVYAVDRPDAGPMGEGIKRTCVRPHEEMVLLGQRLKAATYKAGQRALELGYAEVADWAADLVRKLHASIQTQEQWAEMLTPLVKQYAAISGTGRSVIAPPPGVSAKVIGDPYDPDGLLRLRAANHGEILQRFGAGYLNLGSRGTGGTYNLGEVQAEAAEVAARGEIEALCRAFNRSIVARIYDYNWPDVPIAKRAQVTFSGLDAARTMRRLRTWQTAFEILSVPGATPEDIQAIREEAGLPALDDESMRLASARSQVGAAMGRPVAQSAGQIAAEARARLRAPQGEEEDNG